jgi:hypothetical protein
MHIILPLLVSLCCLTAVSAQKVLQIERYGNPRTTKLYIGEELTYKVYGDDLWRTRHLEDLIIDRNVIVLDDRYVNLKDIEAIQYQRGWTQPISISLYTFGTAWSALALVGTLTDGNPDTRYRPSDAIVSGVSLGVGWGIHQLFGTKTIRLGKRRRLRMLDLTFKKPGTF